MLVVETTGDFESFDMAITTKDMCTSGNVDAKLIGHPTSTLYLTPDQLPAVDADGYTICYRVGTLQWINSDITFKLVNVLVTKFGTSTATAAHIIQAGDPSAVNIDIGFEETSSSVELAGQFLLSTTADCTVSDKIAHVVDGISAVFGIAIISDPGGPYFVCYQTSVSAPYIRSDFTVEVCFFT